MLRFSRSKTIGVLLIVLLGVLYAMPSLLPADTRKSIEQSIPSFLPRWIIPHQAIVLGLDLQGGSHVLLEVDSQAVMRGQVNTLRDDVRRLLREEKIALAGGIGVQARGVTVRGPDPAERAKLLPRPARARAAGRRALRPGRRAALHRDRRAAGRPDHHDGDRGRRQRAVRKAIDQAIEVLRRRVDALGTTEPNIQRQGVGPHPRPGARPAGSAQAEGDPGHHGAARIPAAWPTPARRPATSSSCPPRRRAAR